MADLFDRLVDPEALDHAAHLTVRGKRRRSDVAWFLFRRDEELERLRSELESGSYRPAGFELLIIRDPKPRLIARLPIADRVVQTALVLQMEPIVLRRLRPEAYACRPGYGAHRGVLRLQDLMRRHAYVLHLDIRSYFPSIDRQILLTLLRRRIRDQRFLGLVDQVLHVGRSLYDAPEVRADVGLSAAWPPKGRGLPIGSYTSQLFAAHVYLADLDHFAKRDLKMPGYLRYVDDFFAFADSRSHLRAARERFGEWLDEERGLRLKRPKAPVLSCRGRLHGLGHCIRRDSVEVLPRAKQRFQRRMAAVMYGGDPVDVERSLASFVGVGLF